MERFRNTGQPDWDWWGRLWPTPGETLRRLGISDSDVVAEVGCGNGYFALPAARITAPEPVYALDIEPSLLTELSNLADREAIDNLVPIHCDARNLRNHLPDGVDTVLIANTFHGIEDVSGFLQEVSTALPADGRFVVVNWYDQPREETTVMGEPRGPPAELRLSPAETTDCVESGSAFSLERQVELPPYHYGLVFERARR
ncbi:class I SAM-dependent methyltransferase [Halobellus ordinarius]|uniref:class I SAM-dependent methyltransferase n=1 Tax=Halobellus ordinarius TaxID=3075120 RepID=UPI0028806113|nr:class I SAM-dependent methyltransferase [Halobellus sp. ZY16]